jgi:hypothetical protein
MSMGFDDIKEIIDKTPVIDVHTHLGGEGICQSRTLADIDSYHWVHLELIRAGNIILDLNVICNSAGCIKNQNNSV